MREEIILKLLDRLLGSEDSKQESKTESAFPIGKKVILRWRNAGVIFGTLVSVRSESGVTVYRVANSRRLYQWFCDMGIVLEDVAIHGINADKSKICSTVPLIDVTDSEISLLIPVSEASAKSIESANTYVAS